MTAPAERTIIDARHGAQPHPCRGSWQHIGLNLGGHQTFTCDSGGHSLITPHPAADHHVCKPACADVAAPSADGGLAGHLMRVFLGQELPGYLSVAERQGQPLHMWANWECAGCGGRFAPGTDVGPGSDTLQGHMCQLCTEGS